MRSKTGATRYPVKGYSVTMPVKDESQAHEVSLADDEFKLVFSRLGDRLCIAAAAEFNGYDRDRDWNRARGQPNAHRVETLFPGEGDVGKAQFWTGLGPATRTNVPLTGQPPVPNSFSIPATARSAGPTPAVLAGPLPAS